MIKNIFRFVFNNTLILEEFETGIFLHIQKKQIWLYLIEEYDAINDETTTKDAITTNCLWHIIPKYLKDCS